MAKQLVYNYEFDASAQTIKITGLYSLRTLILITNVTDQQIIYNFADSNSGGTVSYDATNDETTITLEYNTTGMSDSDELQILVDKGGDAKIDAGESLLDPVHKFRVSNPENLIDTDFEYGLQPTKWETIELVDNIPSVYTRASGVSIGGISQANSTQNSDIIRVTCTVDHDLTLGDPIEVQGLKSRTANGKYIVTAVPSVREFTYRASAVQANSTNQVTAYTTIIPGSFFSGSDIKYDASRGIETDNGNPSTLVFETDYTHGLSTSTSLYITNTVGKQTFTISNPSATAADGASTINTSDETIYVDGNNFYENQQIIISPGVGGALPSLQSGSPAPTSSSLCDAAYQAASSACDTLVGSMTFHEYFLQYYLYGSGYAFYNDGARRVFSGKQTTQVVQYLRYGDWNNGTGAYDYFYVGTPSNNYRTTFRASNSGYTNDLLYTGSPVNIGARYSFYSGYDNLVNTLDGRIWFQSTLFQHNTASDYILQVYQIGNLNEITTGGDRSNFFRGGVSSKRPNSSSYRNYDLITTSNIPTSLGNGWYYSWRGVQHRGRWSTNYPGYLGLTIRLENTSWPTDRATSNSSWNLTQSSGYYTLDGSSNTPYNGSRYEIIVMIPYYPSSYGNNSYYGASGSELTFAQMAQTIAQSVSNALEYQSTWTNPSGQNTVKVVPSTSNRITLKSTGDKPYAFSSTGTGPINIETGQVSGAVDNYYTISGVTNTTASIDVSSQINPRTLEFTHSDIILNDSEYYIYYNVADGHGLSDLCEVTFNVSSGSAPAGLSNGTTYYAIVDDAKHFRLASSKLDAETDTNLITGTGSGSFNITISSISGRSSATGNVTTNEDSAVVTGSGTKFTSTYKIGDTFSIVSAGQIVNSFVENTVISIVNDTSLTVATPVGVTTSGAAHYVDTKINVRADGEFLHRPFDGGVDITAGHSPDSTIVRQTRKYFRYQSGKGIQCSMAINFNPARQVRSASGSGTAVTMTTEYPHGLTTGDSVKISGSDDSAYNGTFTVTSADAFTFSYTAGSSVSDADPSGFIDYAISGYSNAGIRAGLFDFQNGFFFEYDGSNLYAVRRSSVQQISGTVTVTTGSNKIFGLNTKFGNQLSNNDRIVIRGQTYKITNVVSDTEIHMQPSYRGIETNGVVVTKTIDTKVAQSNWNIDKADGTGPSGFILDINKIQMVYLDYSWYGAGKIRFGFKDTYGHVKYMHEFIHNNKLNEAYMRTGNIPARYEVYNSGIPTYVPSLFHWGTSVIMDGGFDDDDSYLFTASGNTLTFTNGDADTATTTANSTLTSTGRRYKDYYVQLSFATSDASKFTTGVPLYTADGALSGQPVAYTGYGSGVFYVYVYVSSGYSPPASYPSVANATVVNIGAETVGTTTVDLNSDIPLISIRLAPSADNNLIGALGARDVINRMQLKMQELGISISHDAEIKVILNGSLSNLNYENVGSPSLSQYVAHAAGDTVSDGITIYKFRASGGSTDSSGKRLNASNAFDLSRLTDLGNSILGGNDVFPNGPDIITITASVINTAEIDSTSAFQVASRLSWAESQA